MPSTTARAGGIFMPIINSLSLSAGSKPSACPQLPWRSHSLPLLVGELLLAPQAGLLLPLLGCHCSILRCSPCANVLSFFLNATPLQTTPPARSWAPSWCSPSCRGRSTALQCSSPPPRRTCCA
jgi:hypothetical protein